MIAHCSPQKTSIVDPDILVQALRRAMDHGARFAELYVEDRRSMSLVCENDRVEQIISGVQRGIGIRVAGRGLTIYAFSEDLTEHSILTTVEIATKALQSAPSHPIPPVNLTPRGALNPASVQIPPSTVDTSEKILLLERADRAAHAFNPYVTQVNTMYFESHDHVQIANSEGVWVEHERGRVRLRAQVVASRKGQTYQGFGSWGIGETGGFEAFGALPSAEYIGREAARQAFVLLDAGPAPAGRMPLVVTNGVGGVLFHEACGHGLEGDVITNAGSVYAGQLGTMVASSAITAIDDGILPGAWGSNAFDSEGTPCQRTLLIDQGRLVSYLHDTTSAKREGVCSTGNGRRASFRHAPMPRMTNTYIAPSSYTPDQIIAATASGLFARNFSGGVADMASGTFTFTVREGYVIRNGRLDYPVTGVAIVGKGPDILKQVDMVANDFEIAPVICGKNGQKAMVCVGQPTLRIANVTVGGARKQVTGHDEW